MSKVLDLGDGRGARGTTWALLIAMSLYNLAGVLLPSGPLRLLLELAITRDEVLPAFEGRRAEPSGGEKEAVERKEEYATYSSSSLNGLEAEIPNPRSQEANLVIAREAASIPAATSPLLQQQLKRHKEEDAEGIGLGSSGAELLPSLSFRYF
ncbi:presenilin-like protein At2g29900 [Zingiber officinale]|uniref:presenilin-like protein At2g29900 n=1 Tax=Zingiber officinale TaxID=94328 RepID=UPI001C4C499A|nr:presenilin-like protein At2g29900 [Zingiber officinale]